MTSPFHPYPGVPFPRFPAMGRTIRTVPVPLSLLVELVEATARGDHRSREHAIQLGRDLIAQHERAAAPHDNASAATAAPPAGNQSP